MNVGRKFKFNSDIPQARFYSKLPKTKSDYQNCTIYRILKKVSANQESWKNKKRESPALQINCILALQNYQRERGKVTNNTEQSQVQQNNVQLNRQVHSRYKI